MNELKVSINTQQFVPAFALSETWKSRIFGDRSSTLRGRACVKTLRGIHTGVE